MCERKEPKKKSTLVPSAIIVVILNEVKNLSIYLRTRIRERSFDSFRSLRMTQVSVLLKGTLLRYLLIVILFALIELMKKNIISYFTLPVLYLLVISLARFKLDLNILWLWLGGFLGSVILESDYLFQVFLVQPDLPLSFSVKELWEKKQYQQALVTLYNRHTEIKNLTFHTVFFQIIFYGFSFFILTSSGSFFGSALVLTSLLHLLQEQVGETRGMGMLRESWFSKLNVSLPAASQKIYVGIVILLFLLFTTFLIR